MNWLVSCTHVSYTDERKISHFDTSEMSNDPDVRQMLAVTLCSKGSILGSYAYLRQVFYNACSVAVLSVRILQTMLCSNGYRKVISFGVFFLAKRRRQLC